jgi:branched-chain amino acid transport system substrate-binding protein
MKKLLLILVTLCLVITMTVTTFACKSSAAQEIRVGVIQAQTGMYAGFGAGDIFGIQAAVDDINALGGVDVNGTKMKIKLYIVDDQSDPNKTGTLAESLITQNNVQFLLSGDEPPPMHPGVSTVADRYKIPYITSVGPFEPWAGLREASDTKWPYTWATGLFALGTPAEAPDFRAGQAGYTVGDTWIDMLNLYGDQTNKKVAVLASDDGDGVGWYAGLPNIISTMGYQPIGLDNKLGLLPMETTDFSSVINEWKANNCEILWGNCPAPFFGAFWTQARTLGFEPKIVSIGRAPLFYQDVTAWGGNLPWGIGCEIWWTPTITEYQGIGTTTPMSLAERWTTAKNQPVNPAIGSGYRSVQVLIDAIQRAKSVNADKVNEALATTDLMTIGSRVKFDASHFNRTPIFFGQWFKTDTAAGWELRTVFSKHTFVPVQAEPIFPVPYE